MALEVPVHKVELYYFIIAYTKTSAGYMDYSDPHLMKHIITNKLYLKVPPVNCTQCIKSLCFFFLDFHCSIIMCYSWSNFTFLQCIIF